jgi:hypothetical protein
LQEDWAAFQKNSWAPAPEILHLEHVDISPPDEAHVPTTLLTLPPEIRHQIYRNCEELVFKQPLLYCIATAFNKIQHPLASVSRQVRSEALAIFYSYNTWIVKVEFRMMYEGFQHWIIRLGEGAGSLRLVDLSVRGTLFKPKRTHVQSVLVHGQLVQITPGVATHGREELYSPPDGDASFKIDLSEKHIGGKVQLVRNDGTKEAGEKGRAQLARMVVGLWEKRRAGTLNGQDWVTMVDDFLTFIGGWVSIDVDLVYDPANIPTVNVLVLSSECPRAHACQLQLPHGDFGLTEFSRNFPKVCTILSFSFSFPCICLFGDSTHPHAFSAGRKGNLWSFMVSPERERVERHHHPLLMNVDLIIKRTDFWNNGVHDEFPSNGDGAHGGSSETREIIYPPILPFWSSQITWNLQ